MSLDFYFLLSFRARFITSCESRFGNFANRKIIYALYVRSACRRRSRIARLSPCEERTRYRQVIHNMPFAMPFIDVKIRMLWNPEMSSRSRSQGRTRAFYSAGGTFNSCLYFASLPRFLCMQMTVNDRKKCERSEGQSKPGSM